MVVAVVAMVVAGLAAGSGVGDRDDVATGDTDPGSPNSVAPPAELSVPEPGESIGGETPCPAEDGSSPRTTRFSEAPPMCIDPTARYKAVIHTSEGELEMLLDTEGAPNTVNNFVVLSRYHFYDGVPFFTIQPRKVVVTGDATGEPAIGKGGPGYTIPDEIPDVGVIYPVGTMAMFTDQPDQNGSRFLIATGENAAGLEPRFTAFGIMLDGLDALNQIQFQGDPITGDPIGEVTIERIEIVELDEADDEPGDEDQDGDGDENEPTGEPSAEPTTAATTPP
jgi:cyclophilin family peptidyl-prolyl cis-trans isomerase